MKCPECKAWASVKDTRQRQAGTYRRYKCANGHKFSTDEQPVKYINAGLGIGFIQQPKGSP